jgi:hypothetical protein
MQKNLAKLAVVKLKHEARDEVNFTALIYSDSPNGNTLNGRSSAASRRFFLLHF